MNNTPYISIPEILDAPTGINWNSIPNRDSTDQERLAEQEQLARRGTSWVITTAKQNLTASIDQDLVKIGGRRCSMREGRLYVVTRYSPVTEIILVEISNDGLHWVDLRGSYIIDGRSAFYCVQPGVSINGYTGPSSGSQWLRVTYLNGFVNTEIAAAVTATDTTVDVVDPSGIQPGLELSIYDHDRNEDVVVDSSYSSGITIPLVTPLQFDHDQGVRISAMPIGVREATLLAVIHYVRVRGRSSITIQPTGGSRSIVAVNQVEELSEAKGLIQPYVRVL